MSKLMEQVKEIQRMEHLCSKCQGTGHVTPLHVSTDDESDIIRCHSCMAGWVPSPAVDTLVEVIERLKAVVSKAQYTLQQVEWGYDRHSYCPYCGDLPSDGHHVDCELKGVLEAIE